MFYSLKKCRHDHKRPWVWFPDRTSPLSSWRLTDFKITFFCAESAKIYADRVERNVSVLRESVICSALPASRSRQKPEAATLKATPAEKQAPRQTLLLQV